MDDTNRRRKRPRIAHRGQQSASVRRSTANKNPPTPGAAHEHLHLHPHPRRTMTATERADDAEMVVVHMLCRFGADIVGPYAWMCRRAWLTLSNGLPFDTDAEIAEHAAWMDKPENASYRASLVSAIEYIRRVAAKPPLWKLPAGPPDWLRL